MLARFLGHAKPTRSADIVSSQLFNEQTFYSQFKRDLSKAKREIIIESPFLTTRRVQFLCPELRGAIQRGVTVIVNTRDPQEHDDYLRLEAEQAIPALQAMGIKVLLTGRHHRKLAIIDKTVLLKEA